MNTYLLLKTLHILSSVLLVGTGLGSAFYMFFAAVEVILTLLIVWYAWRWPRVSASVA